MNSGSPPRWHAVGLRLCDALLELGWLFAVLAVPIYFNIDDVRAFEPDKAILLRDIAAILLVIAILRLTLWLLHASFAPRVPGADGALVLPRAWQGLRTIAHRYPTLLPMLALIGVMLLATAASLLPDVSWHGSYDRGQGAMTTLAYLTCALLILGLLRRPSQIRRLCIAMALAGVAPAGYGWVQHFGHDPLPWQQADLLARVPGTMGNPIFLGALLVITIPLALGQVLLAARSAATDERAFHPSPIFRRDVLTTGMIVPALSLAGDRAMRVALWAVVVILQLGALYFTKSRGPFAGLLAGLTVFGLATARAWRLPRLRRVIIRIAAVLLLILLSGNLIGTKLLGHMREGSALRLVQWTPASSGSSEVRLDIWGPALRLVFTRPLLGCGPDALQWCYYPVYPTALRHIEAPNAVPDRTHNVFLDAAVETGLPGLAALLWLLGMTAYTLWRLAGAATDPGRRLMAAALLAALAAHVVEGCFGIPIVATQLLTWVIAGAATTLTILEGPALESAGNVQPRRRGMAWVRRGTRASGAADPVDAVLPANASPGRASALRSAAVLAGTVACLAAAILSWQVVQAGATADTADSAARRAADLETAALGNSGQAPLPHGLAPRPILALRQFAAAVALQNQAIALQPDEEAYLLGAGNMLVEWASAAGQVGGPAASQASDLYLRALLDFGRTARLNPYDPDPLRNTGKAYERWAGLGHDPAQPLTWNQSLLGRAAEAFARASHLAPHHPDTLTSWAQVALWQGNSFQAARLATRALALDSRDGEGYRIRAEAERVSGRRRAALRDWRLALGDPSTPHQGEINDHLALAEATWANERCAALQDARHALAYNDVPDAGLMHEIVHVDAGACHT